MDVVLLENKHGFNHQMDIDSTHNNLYRMEEPIVQRIQNVCPLSAIYPKKKKNLLMH